MRNRSTRLGRALVVVSAIAAGDRAFANTGIQLPLSQYQAGAEQTTLVPNGNFSNPGPEDSPGSGLYSNPPSWQGREGDLVVRAPVYTNPSYAGAIDPYAVVMPSNTFVNKWEQPVTGLEPNANYVLSAYMWNGGRHDLTGNGAGDLLTVKLVDPADDINNNVSLTLEGNGSNGQSAASGRLGYLTFNEAQVRHWSAIDLYVIGETGTVGGAIPENWAQVDNVAITRLDQFNAQIWTATGGGNWSDGSNWLSQLVPAGEGAIASLPSAPAQTINVDGAVTLGALKLNGGSYTLSGSGNLTLASPGGTSPKGVPEIYVPAGTHAVNVPIAMPQGGILNVAPAASLTLASVNVGAGTLRIIPGSSVSRINSISIATGAKVDLANNKLVTASPVGSWNGLAYTGVTGMIQSGRNEGTWDGSGIITSRPDALTDYTTVGIATASQVLGIGATETDVWFGQTVTGSDTLVAYTYGGDANLDGEINIDDYGQIDFNVGLSGSVFGYFNGDFNYDGLINIDDYGIIDFNIGIQGPPYGGGASAAAPGIAAVPEPASLGLGVISMLLLRRRRRTS